MNKFLFVAFISLSLTLACHPSCECDEGSQVCKKCILEDIGSVMDKYQRSCPCPIGYYTSSRNPFTCTELLISDQGQDQGEGQLPDSADQQLVIKDDACKKECEVKIKDISVLSNCYQEVVDGVNYVFSDVSLNLENVSINDECKVQFVHKIQFQNPTSNNYEDLDSKYIVIGSNGSLQIKIPLIDVYNLSSQETVGDQQIAQTINLMSLIGTGDKILKQIKWAICIYTNREQVQVFQFDVDIQTTTQDCEDCIVIVDLDTVGKIYTDESFATEKNAPFSYFVGDTFYAKITFADASFTKFLKFVSLLYKNDLGQIFDLSAQTVHSWQDNGLTIALPLTEPSSPAIIQIQMLIDPTSGGRFRFLQNADQQNKNTNFQFDVKPLDGSDNTDHGDEASSTIMIFGLINFMALLLI